MNCVSFLAGLSFGFLVAAARLNDYNVIHNMLLLRQSYVFLMMATAIGTAAPKSTGSSSSWRFGRRPVRALIREAS